MSKPMNAPIETADFYCGAGGWTEAITQAGGRLGRPVNLLAVNHWPRAIETHTLNHPEAKHLCQRVDTLVPQHEVPGRRLDMLLASPECTHFARARGGKPMDDQSRIQAWNVLPWLQELRVDNVLIENVPEFLEWGPLGMKGKPLKAQKGITFQAWFSALKSLGYTAEYRVLSAADYGDATTRRRLFIMARKGVHRSLPWPGPTTSRKSWKPAGDVIDLSDKGDSIYGRRRAISERTLERIQAGLKRHKRGEPFLLKYYGTGISKPLTEPLDTITTKDRFALVQPSNTDIRLRVLRIAELKAAMGFPKQYRFTGTDADQKKQIGNAVPVGVARTLCFSMLKTG